jgi:hypothetical protein
MRKKKKRKKAKQSCFLVKNYIMRQDQKHSNLTTQERKQRMMRLHNWSVQIVQQQRHHFGEEMMKVHRYVMHVGYSKYSFLRGKEMGY